MQYTTTPTRKKITATVIKIIMSKIGIFGKICPTDFFFFFSVFYIIICLWEIREKNTHSCICFFPIVFICLFVVLSMFICRQLMRFQKNAAPPPRPRRVKWSHEWGTFRFVVWKSISKRLRLPTNERKHKERTNK